MAIPLPFWAFTIAFLLNNCAFNVLCQLQSSINPDMGPLSVAISYIASTAVCLLLVPLLFKATSPRFQFTISSIGYLVYAVANFYPAWYTLYPAAIALGFATGVAWSSATNFVSVVSCDNKVESSILYSLFTGIVQFSSILGNGIALGTVRHFAEEEVLTDSNLTDIKIIETTSCVMNSPIFDQNLTTSDKPHDLTVQGKQALSIGCSLFHVSATIMLYLGLCGKYSKITNKSSKKGAKLIINTFKGMLKQIKNTNQILICPMTIYSATVLSFIMSDITRHLITPCLGVQMVPVLMIMYGIGISFGCFASSKLLSVLNVKVLMALVGAFDGACFIFIYFWTGAHALEVTMILCAGLGFTAGIFESGIPTIYSRLFAGDSESAFSLWNMLFNIGSAIVFGWSSFLNLKSKLVILFIALVIQKSLYL